ncbi:hypothetical protein [Piscinibacter terrae]|uniref:TIGR02301 family protein n=1 Tax=Piscinibacter terrae TaxID=2496871 RepID=A0A3N7HNN9_9BURK|nr:hypothetical protein [Albitalea terrae]RQP23730.1 hypothetical protein DZC73_16530 [Albitalea terrae]
MKYFLALALATTTLSSVAAPDAQPFDEKKAVLALDATVAEYRLYATCLSLVPDTLPLVEKLWQSQVEQATASLNAIGATPTFKAYFLVTTKFTNLLDRSMKLGDAIALCEKNKEAQIRFHSFAYPNLAAAIAGKRAAP